MNLRHLLTVLVLCSGCNLYAQQSKLALKFSKVININQAQRHLNILASNEYEGRETGKPGAQKAAHYLAAEFKKLGLIAPVNDSYFMEVPMMERRMLVNRFLIDSEPVNGSEYFLYGNYFDKEISTSKIVYVGYGSDAELAGISLEDKILLWINEDKEPATTEPLLSFRLNATRKSILAKLEARNPALILAVNRDIPGFISHFGSSVLGSRFMLKSQADTLRLKSVGLVHLGPDVADMLLKHTGKTLNALKEAAAVNVESRMISCPLQISYQSQVRRAIGHEVMGFLPGTDSKLKDEVLVFSAHYDHIGLNQAGADKVNNGADDNGSGTSALLEIAKAFMQAKKAGHGPRRSLLFLSHVAEEKGLLGSQYYTDHPVFPLTRTIANLNIDMIGRVDEIHEKRPDSTNYVYVIGSDRLSAQLKQLSENANKNYTRLHLDYKFDDLNDPEDNYRRSDHYNFAKHGIPVIFYYGGNHKQYHQPDDEVRFINFSLLVKRSRLVFFTGWELANQDTRPLINTKHHN